MPTELHERLAQAAEQEDVSLNRFVTQALATRVDSPERHVPQAARALRVAVATNLAIVVLAGIVAIILFVLAIQRGI